MKSSTRLLHACASSAKHMRCRIGPCSRCLSLCRSTFFPDMLQSLLPTAWKGDPTVAFLIPHLLFARRRSRGGGTCNASRAKKRLRSWRIAQAEPVSLWFSWYKKFSYLQLVAEILVVSTVTHFKLPVAFGGVESFTGSVRAADSPDFVQLLRASSTRATKYPFRCLPSLGAETMCWR